MGEEDETAESVFPDKDDENKEDRRTSSDSINDRSRDGDDRSRRSCRSRDRRSISRHRSGDDERRSKSRHRSSSRRDKDREKGVKSSKSRTKDGREALRESRHKARSSRSLRIDDKEPREKESVIRRHTTSHSRKRESRHNDREKRREDETPEERKKRHEADDERRRRDRDRHRSSRRKEETSEERRKRHKEEEERRKNETSEERRKRHKEEDERRRRSSRRKDETSEERKKRHKDDDERRRREKKEREEEDRHKKEREEKRQKEKEERRKEAEEKKQARIDMRESRGPRVEKKRGSVMQLNRGDMRSINKGKFTDIYTLGKKIYEGEDTVVHKCTHWATGTERCVKIIPKKSSSCHEFDMLKELDHPNTLAMYDLFVHESDLGFEWYLVIDLCKGGTLYNYLQKRSSRPRKEDEKEASEKKEEDDMFGLGGLVTAITGPEEELSDIEEGEYYGMDETEVKKVILQVLSCVNYLHKNRLVHADLKPHNVLLSEWKDLSSIKLIDFDNSALLRNPDDKISFKKGTPPYMAPEVHAGEKYSYKCDVWSCGVMTYELLSNSLPFGSEDESKEEEIAQRVKEGKFTMAGPAWGHVSDDAKDFVKSLLVLREKKRPSAEKAIVHKWLGGGKSAGSAAGNAADMINLSNNDMAKSAMSNFKNFKADSKLKKATCAFIASQLLTKEEKDKIDVLFRTMDITRDGKLSKTEVKAGLFKIEGKFLSDEEIDAMFARVDCDGTGEIEYSEFVIASMSEEDLLSKDRLRKAFQLFDQDNSGTITVDELRECFAMFLKGSDLGDDYIDKIIAQVDENGDGNVSFEEFCVMMTDGNFG